MLKFDIEKNRVQSCGVDEELINRFDSIVDSTENPMPMIFTQEEYVFITSLPAAKRACYYTVAFCCKEALYKAAETPYNYNQITFLYNEEKKQCKTSWEIEPFQEADLIITKIETEVEIFDSSNCSVQLLLTLQNRNN